MDPNGDYNVGDVTVELDGFEITKGDGAKGAFVSLGHDGTRFTSKKSVDGEVTLSKRHNPRRPLFITLLKASASNKVLSSEAVERGATLKIRRATGELLFEGHAFRDKPSRDLGDERRWELVAVGEEGDD